MYTRETEIRHLTAADLYKFAVILDQMESWKKLMSCIPKDLRAPPGQAVGKYTIDHMRLIENASIRQNRSCTEILFSEWGTSGKIRATVGDLRDLLVKAELFRAADYVAKHFLNESPPARPATGPAARIDISLPDICTEEIKQVEGALENMAYPDSSAIQRNALVRTNLNNEDFYEKLGPNRNKFAVKTSNEIEGSVKEQGSSRQNHDANVDIQISDMIKFSASTISNGAIPSISTLLNDTNKQEPLQTFFEENVNDLQPTSASEGIPAFSELLSDPVEVSIHESYRNTQVADDRNLALESKDYIPMLSALQPVNSDTLESLDNLPNLSVLNLRSVSADESKSKNDGISDSNFNIPNLSVIGGTMLDQSVSTQSTDLPLSISRSNFSNNLNSNNYSATSDNSEQLHDSEEYIPQLSLLQN